MELFTSAFRDGDLIPPKYTCDGENVSPPLEWSGVPESAKSLVLIVEDPDAPRGTFLHWLIWGIDPAEKGLPEGAGAGSKTPGGARQGRNGFGKPGYGGPCPPSGTHRYIFRLLAVSTAPNLASSATQEDVERAIAGHLGATAQLMGRYGRSVRNLNQ